MPNAARQVEQARVFTCEYVRPHAARQGLIIRMYNHACGVAIERSNSSIPVPCLEAFLGTLPRNVSAQLTDPNPSVLRLSQPAFSWC